MLEKYATLDNLCIVGLVLILIPLVFWILMDIGKLILRVYDKFYEAITGEIRTSERKRIKKEIIVDKIEENINWDKLRELKNG